MSKPASAGRKRGERGQVLVEFALTSVIFFLLVFGIIDMARLFESWVAVQHAAREATRYAITGQSTCAGASGRNNCIEWTAKKATAGMARGGEDASDSDVTVTFKAWDYQTSSWTGPTNNATGKQCDQVEVTVTYRHDLMSPIISAIAPSLTVSGSQRMTNEPFGSCTINDGVS
jgi:Flp pilus assembly protein TadG